MHELNIEPDFIINLIDLGIRIWRATIFNNTSSSCIDIIYIGYCRGNIINEIVA